MWKKALWIYLGLYILGVVYVTLNSIVQAIQSGDFQLSTLILSLLIFLPAGVLAWGLRKGTVSILLVLLGLLIVAVPVAGILKFNTMGPDTIGKVLLFLPMLAGLFYFGYRRAFNR
ncbi:MAG: hypothetical protein GYA17_18500 [Chloroflexi bacterium]|jgi:hypothetical protein|nr:hypothetical protein [Anaerolineaceae bacterium]NMB90355.1 hypothetical protein [Chloroflexota bacterium]